MEKVASHINEMQKIYEDYGCVFDQLAAEQSGADKQVNTMTHTHTLERHLCASRTLKVFFFPPPSGDGDLDGGVSGPLVGGLVEPTALSGSLEEGTRADAVWWVKSLLHTSLLAQVITDGE